jgi:hypothetical protein
LRRASVEGRRQAGAHAAHERNPAIAFTLREPAPFHAGGDVVGVARGRFEGEDGPLDLQLGLGRQRAHLPAHALGPGPLVRGGEPEEAGQPRRVDRKQHEQQVGCLVRQPHDAARIVGSLGQEPAAEIQETLGAGQAVGGRDARVNGARPLVGDRLQGACNQVGLRHHARACSKQQRKHRPDGPSLKPAAQT